MEKLWYDLGVSCEQALLYIYIYISFGSRLFTTASLPTSWRRVCLPIKEMLRFIDSVHYSKLSLVILNTANVLSVLLEQMAIQNDHNSYCFMNLSLFFFYFIFQTFHEDTQAMWIFRLLFTMSVLPVIFHPTPFQMLYCTSGSSNKLAFPVYLHHQYSLRRALQTVGV